MKSGNLNFLEPSGPLRACNGTALPFTFTCDVNRLYCLVACSAQQYFSTLHHKRHDFRKKEKKCYWTKNVCFDFLCNFCPMGAELLYAVRRTYGLTDGRTKLTVVFRNFANAPKNSICCQHSEFMCQVWISEQTVTVPLHSINRSVAIIERWKRLLRGTNWNFEYTCG